MTVQALTDQIAALHNEMRELTLAAGVTEDTYMKIQEVKPQTQVYHFKERLEFLQNVREAEYQSLLNIWTLLKPEVWKMYEGFMANTLAESKLLRAARKNLKKVWRKKYVEEEDQQDSGQPNPVTESV